MKIIAATLGLRFQNGISNLDELDSLVERIAVALFGDDATVDTTTTPDLDDPETDYIIEFTLRE